MYKHSFHSYPHNYSHKYNINEMSILNVDLTSYGINQAGALGTSNVSIPTAAVISTTLSNKVGTIGSVITPSTANTLSITADVISAHVGSSVNYGVVRGVTTANTTLGLNTGTSTGADNVLIGHNTAINVTTGSDNIVIGSNSGISVISQSNIIILGSNSSTGAAINTCLIGNNQTIVANDAIVFGGYKLINMPDLSSHSATAVLTANPITGDILRNDTPVVWSTDSIDALADVDTTTIAPVPNDILEWNGTNWVPTSPVNNGTIFSVFAERNGAVVTNENFAFGNGSSAVSNALVVPMDCELFAITVQATVAGTNTIIEVLRNGISIANTGQFSAVPVNVQVGPIAFTAGQSVGFNTQFSDGTVSMVQVSAWLRIKSTPSSTSLMSDMLDVSAAGILPNEILQWDGANFIRGKTVKVGTLAGAGEGLLQTASAVAGDGYVETPWVYTNVIQREGTRNNLGSTVMDMSVDNTFSFRTSGTVQASIDPAGIFLFHQSYVHCENSVAGNTTNNLNPVPPARATVQITGNTTILGAFTVVGDHIQCNFDGRVMIQFNIHIRVDGGGTRQASSMRLQRTRAAVLLELGPISSTGYIRNAEGQAESSFHNSNILDVLNGDQYEIVSYRESTEVVPSYLAIIGSSNMIITRI